MTLTVREIELVQTSFRHIEPISGLAGELFFARLFAEDAQMQALFKGEMAVEGQQLMEVLTTLVHGLTDWEGVVPVARDLAGRLVAQGMTPAMYGPIGEALIFTLAQSLDEAFDVETRAAWEAAYAQVSEAMVTSAYAKAAPSKTVAAE
ncbi:MAG: globin domain-containing protein [Pseudomonadota bacterium]